MTMVSTQPRAIVKGAGPSGLAAAITLAQEGYKVVIVEQRPPHPSRKNMVGPAIITISSHLMPGSYPTGRTLHSR